MTVIFIAHGVFTYTAPCILNSHVAQYFSSICLFVSNVICVNLTPESPHCVCRVPQLMRRTPSLVEANCTGSLLSLAQSFMVKVQTPKSLLQVTC